MVALRGVPIGSLVVAFAIIGVVLALTGHDTWETYRKIVEAGFTGNGAMSATLISATPILFTGLAAAAFRMQLFNIGAEGRLYLGAVGVVDRSPARRPRRDVDAALVVAMCVAAAALGALWALDPGVLRAFARTNEIITSLMLNYVAGLLLTYLIFDSSSYWRDTSTLQARACRCRCPRPPTGRPSVRRVVVPLGFLLGILAAFALWVLYSRMRFGFEVGVIADSPRPARGTPACGHAGRSSRSWPSPARSRASEGRARSRTSRTLDGSPTGLQAAAFGYTGIVVAALALQPVRGLSRGGAHRRAAERRLHAAGTGLPVRSRGRDAKSSSSVPWAASCSCATGCGSRGSAQEATTEGAGL